MSGPVAGSATGLHRVGRQFALLWIGETVCDLGTVLTQFALGVWIYQRSGSTQQFAFVSLAALLPAMLVAPIAGTLADHFDKRRVIVAVDAVSLVVTVGLALLLSLGRLAFQHLYVANALGAIMASIRSPSYQAALTAAVPEDSFTRANGLRNLASSVLALVGPLLAAGVMAWIGLGGILMINLVTMVAGLVAVCWALFDPSGREVATAAASKRSVIEAFTTTVSSAIAYFRREPLMLGLLLYTVVHDGALVLASTMLAPLVLSTYSSATLGLVSSCGAAGGLIGALVLVVVNPSTKLVLWLLVSNICVSICVMVVGAQTSVAVFCTCAFLALLAGSGSGACSTALWMRNTPSATRGSIAALLNLSHLAVASAVLAIGGLVSDRVLEPALAKGGAWEGTVGRWIGVGQGRGLGFLFVVAGGLCTLVSLIALGRSGVRRLDQLAATRRGASVSR